MEMSDDSKHVLLIAMPFAALEIPSIQLAILESYAKERSVPIQTEHLYLKAAEFYGLYNYNFLIYPPNDSHNAQMLFSKHVLPEHWNKNVEKIKELFIKKIARDKSIEQMFSFEQYEERTDQFYQWVLKNIDWIPYDIIGFTLNYGQLLPSLAIAKKIKELWPEKKIVFGGSRTIGELGIGVLKAFPYIDFIVSGDGEEALYQLATDFQHYQSISGLIYRSGNEIVWNRSDSVIDLNNLPIPTYEQFYRDLAETSEQIKQYFIHFRGRLPIEISRGCWWNKCTFCNLNIQHQHYREKHVDRIIEEIKTLQERYKMLRFQIIGNTLPKENYRILLDKIIQLDKPFTFFAEARAGQLTSEDYTSLREAGFTEIQTGIESFSSHYLKKMNKGTRVIDNIAALKFCMENGIANKYNLIVNYPNEEPVDFEETKKKIKIIKSYLYPPQLCSLQIFYGSPIQQHPEQFNIETLGVTDFDKTIYRSEMLKHRINFIYDFKKKIDFGMNNWIELVAEWIAERKQRIEKAMKSIYPIDEYIFYFIDGGSYVEIYDNRDIQKFCYHMLEGIKRTVFLSCIDVISFQEIQNRFTNIPDYELAAILNTFENQNIVFREDNYYLSLPLNYQKIRNQLRRRKIEQLPKNLIQKEFINIPDVI